MNQENLSRNKIPTLLFRIGRSSAVFFALFFLGDLAFEIVWNTINNVHSVRDTLNAFFSEGSGVLKKVVLAFVYGLLYEVLVRRILTNDRGGQNTLTD